MRFEGEFPAVPLAVPAIRRSVAAVAEECGLSGVEVDNVRLAVSEAATNALLHGYRGEDGVIRVTADVVDGLLHVVVADFGGGIAPRSDSEGLGLGLPIMSSVSRDVQVVSEGRGTEIRLVFDCPASEAA